MRARQDDSENEDERGDEFSILCSDSTTNWSKERTRRNSCSRGTFSLVELFLLLSFEDVPVFSSRVEIGNPLKNCILAYLSS